MNKAELIDAIASGSKLTKADAGRVFPPTPIHTNADSDTQFRGQALVGNVTYELSGLNAADFSIANNADAPAYASRYSRVPDKFGNITPISTLLRFSPTTVGSKAALLTVTCLGSAVSVTYNLSGEATDH